MAGPASEVHVAQAAVDAVPAPAVLTTPESAIRSYLDWTTYAYRTGQSRTASDAMSPSELVHVDSYIQYNIEQQRLIDQKLHSLKLGTPKMGGSSATVTAVEDWTYSYLSIASGNASIGGPYKVTYDTTYTVTELKKGTWVVDSVKSTPRGAVK